MMGLLMLLTLFGSCWGLEADLEYHYRYNGRVAAGIPDLKDQFSGAGIQADVTVQITSDRKTFFQFSNIQVGEYHDEVVCDTREPLPIPYHPLETGKDLLEKPFEVHFTGTEVTEYMKAPAEPVWVTNIRKSVANIFRIPPLLVNYDIPTNVFKQATFPTIETLMGGRCRSWYSFIKLQDEQAAMENYQRESVVEVDAQRIPDPASTPGVKTHSTKKIKKGKKKTHGTKRPGGGAKTGGGTKTGGGGGGGPGEYSRYGIDDTLWTLTRSIDFGGCEDLVKWEIHGNKKTDESIVRSSVGTYLLRGDESGIRIERAVVEGTIFLFTSEETHEQVDTYTNQTLELRSVRPITNQLTLEYEPHEYHSWHYQVDHLLTDPEDRVHEHHPILEQAVTGVTVTRETVNEIKDKVTTTLVHLASRMTTIPYSKTPLVKEARELVEEVTLLTLEEIEDIFSHIVEDELYETKRHIFYEALITAGTKPSLSYLLNKMNDQAFREQYHRTVQNFFDNIHISLKNPLLIPDIMHLVMQLTWENHDEEFRATALLNFATLAHDLCLNPSKWEQYSDNTCDTEHTCSPSLIMNEFFPSLVEGVHDKESPLWRRLVYVQALANLGTPETIDTIKHIVLGDEETNVLLRTNAISNLGSSYLPASSVGEVFDLLMPVYENIAEHHDVRIYAFVVMASWKPPIGWWQHMAISTWHDPSSDVANMVSSVITSNSHMQFPFSKTAAQVAHLVKPPTTTSLTHSAKLFLYEYYYNCKVKSNLHLRWLANPEGVFPKRVVFNLRMNAFFGFSEDLFLVLGHEDLDHIFKVYLDTYLSSEADLKRPKEDDMTEIVHNMYEELMEGLGVTRGNNYVLKLFAKMKQMLYYFALDNDSDSSNYGSLSNVHLLSKLPHLMRSVDYTEVLPTDLGLPFFVRYVDQTAFWLHWTVATSQIISTSPITGVEKFKSSFKFTFDFSRDNTLMVKTLLPWSQEHFAVGTGLHNTLSLVAPFNLHVSVDLKLKEVYLTVASGDHKVQLLDSHNYPFTYLGGPFPTTIHIQESQFRTIRVVHPDVFSQHGQLLPPVFGLSIDSKWSADFANPLSLPNILSGKIHPFTPSYETWEYILEFDPVVSTTKSVTIIITYVTLEKSERIVQEQGEGQETQGFVDIEELTQDSQTFTTFEGFDDAQEAETFDTQQQTESRQRIAKLQQQVIPIAGGFVQSVSVGFDLQGTITRRYEAVVTWASSMSATQKSTKIQFNFFKHPPQGVLEEHHTTCLNAQLVKPFFEPLTTIEKVLATDFHSTVKVELYDGRDCEEQPVLKIQGSLDVSDEHMSRIREELSHGCDKESHHLLPIDLITTFLYDHAHFSAHWTDYFPENLMNLTYCLDDYIHDSLFPGICSRDHTARHPDHHIEVDATKCLDTNRWTVRETKPQEVAVLHGLKLPVLVEELGGPAMVSRSFRYNIVRGRVADYCVLDGTTVRTYDGRVFHHEPDVCFDTITLIHPLSYSEYDKRQKIFSVRKTHEWEARITWPWAGRVIDVTSSTLMVNGEPHEGTDKLFKFIKKEGYSVIRFRDGVLLKISDKVEVVAPQSLRGKVDGLCGRMDGVKTHDLVGPKGCVYDDPELFSIAWKTIAPGCNFFSLRAQKNQVQEFQETCPYDAYVPTGVLHPDILTDCTDWQHQERELQNSTCRAITATPICKPECRPNLIISTPIVYDCEVGESLHDQQQVGSASRECHPHTFLTTYPSSCVHQ